MRGCSRIRFPPSLRPAGPKSRRLLQPRELVKNDDIIFWEKVSNQHLRYYNEGVTATISVIETKDNTLYYVSEGKVGGGHPKQS